MTVTLVEIQATTSGTLGTSDTVTFTNTPAAGDVVIVMAHQFNIAAVTGVSGLGATWTQGYQNSTSSNGSVTVYKGVGATSSGVVTVTATSANAPGQIVALLLRGLSDSTVTGANSNSTSSPTVTVDGVSFVIGSAYSSGGTVTLTPGPTGWTTMARVASGGRSIMAGYHAPASSTTESFTVTSSTTFPHASIIRIGSLASAPSPQSFTGNAASATITAGVGSFQTSTPSPQSFTGAAAVQAVTAPAGTFVAGTKVPQSFDGAAPAVTVTAGAGSFVAGSGGTPAAFTGTAAGVTVTAGAGTFVAGSTAGPASFTGVSANAAITAGLGRFSTASVVVTPISVDLTAGASLTVGTTLNVTPISVDLTSGTVLRAAIPRTYINDPRTGLPQYQLRVVDDAGTPVADIALKATMDELDEAVNDPTTFGFTLPTLDKRTALVTPTDYQRPPTLQLWRGQYLAGWVDVLRAVPSSDGATTSFQCQDRRWTLEHEHIGKSPLRNLIRNGDFSEGDKYGTYGWDPDSTPAAQPLHSVVADDFSSSGYALELTGADKSQLVVDEVATEAVFAPNSATYLSGGEAQIQSVGNTIPNGSVIHLTGHTANNSINGDYGDGLTLSLNRALAAKGTLAAMGKGFTFTLADTSAYKAGTFVTGSQCVGRGFYSPRGPNATDSQQAYNRRVTIAYEGVADGTKSAQWRQVSARVTHDASKKRPLTVTAAGEFKITTYSGPNRDNVAVKLTLAKASAPNTILQTQTVSMDGSAGMDSYQGSEVSVDVPADGNEYLLRAYYYAPHGTLRWIDIGLYPDDVLGFYGVDQALIVKAHIEHAQDPTMGRATLNLATNCQPTGIPRTREYMFRDRMPIATAVEEFPSLNRGVDIDLAITPTTRTVTTYYPRQGEPSEEVLALGRNIARYEAPVDLTQVATSVVVQADSVGSHRQEGHAVVASRLGGMILEDIVKAEKETPYRDLQGGAVDRLRLYGGPFPLLSVDCLPSATSALIDRVRKGDTVRVIINDGRTNIDGMFRVVKRKLDPNTDALSYTLAQEA